MTVRGLFSPRPDLGKDGIRMRLIDAIDKVLVVASDSCHSGLRRRRAPSGLVRAVGQLLVTGLGGHSIPAWGLRTSSVAASLAVRRPGRPGFRFGQPEGVSR